MIVIFEQQERIKSDTYVWHEQDGRLGARTPPGTPHRALAFPCTALHGRHAQLPRRAGTLILERPAADSRDMHRAPAAYA